MELSHNPVIFECNVTQNPASFVFNRKRHVADCVRELRN